MRAAGGCVCLYPCSMFGRSVGTGVVSCLAGATAAMDAIHEHFCGHGNPFTVLSIGSGRWIIDSIPPFTDH